MKLLTTAMAASAVLFSAANAQNDNESLSDVKQYFEAYMINNYKNCNSATEPAAADVSQCSGAYSWEEARAVSKCIIENDSLTDSGTLPTDTSALNDAIPSLMTFLPMLEQKSTQDKLFNLLKNDLIPNAVGLLGCFMTIEPGVLLLVQDLLAGANLDRTKFDQAIQSIIETFKQNVSTRRLFGAERTLLGECPAELVKNGESYPLALPFDGINKSIAQEECSCDDFAYVAPPAGQKYLDQLLVEFVADNKANLEKFVTDVNAFANAAAMFVQSDDTANQAMCQSDARRLQAGKKTLAECMQPLYQENSKTMELVNGLLFDGLDAKCAGVDFCDPSAFPIVNAARYGAANLQAIKTLNMGLMTEVMQIGNTVTNLCDVETSNTGSASTTAFPVVALAFSALAAAGSMH